MSIKNGHALSWFAALFLLSSLRLFPQCSDVSFVHIGREEGLSQNTVYTIIQDRRGFMWFGTENGLNRFDGYDFTVFHPVPGDPASLSHSAILKIFEDREGVLWIGTLNGGLDRLDPAGGGFRHYRHAADKTDTLSNDIVSAIYEDRAGALWVGTDAGLDRLDRRTGRFRHFPLATDRPGASNHVHDISEDRDGSLWIATFGGGLVHFSPASGRFTCYRNDAGDPSSMSSDFLFRVLPDGQGTLWVCSRDGLNRFDARTGRCRRVPIQPELDGAPRRDVVNAILADRDGRIWLGTEAGLACLDPRSEAVTLQRHDPLDALSLGSDQVSALCEDRSGILWVGSDDRGIDRFNPKRKKFFHCRSTPGRPDTLGSNTVYSFWEEPQGILWIGTHGGLDRLDRQKNSFRHFGYGRGEEDGLYRAPVRCLLGSGAGGIWLGTDGNGLHLFDPRSGRSTAFHHDAGDPRSISHERILSLCRDTAGALWIGTYGGGLNRLDREGGPFTRFQFAEDDPNSLSDNIVRAVLEDRSGALWAGTYGGGLDRLDRETGSFRRFRHDSGDPASLSNDYVFCLHEDRDGVLWIGTLNGGLNRMDREAGTFRRFTRADGLASDMITGIAEDRAGNLWLTTNEGMTRFSPRTGQVRNYDVSDGLQGKAFISNSCLAGGNGEIFAGGANGFNLFNPLDIVDDPYVPPVRITSFKVQNREVRLPRPVWETGAVELGPKEQLFSFEFAALDYAAPEKNRYAFKLEGLTDDWIPVAANRRLASFSRLPPGKYVFRVRGSNHDGVWNEREAVLVIRVRPPWWRTGWFLSLLAAAVAFLTWEWNRTRLRRRAGKVRTAEAMDQLFEQCTLSPREREIALLLLKGRTNKEIGEQLFIELSTVKIHVHHVLRKLGVANRTQLLRLFQNLKT